MNVPHHRQRASTGWIPELDGLRAVAVIAVMLSHWAPLTPHHAETAGEAGVNCFFVLSGYLITQILLQCREAENRKHALFAFYARRSLRIFPVYYSTIAVTWWLRALPDDEETLWHLCYASNIYFFQAEAWGGSASHFWSLAVEEQFYLLWPLVVLFVKKKWLRLAPEITILLGLAGRVAGHVGFPENPFWRLLPRANLTPFGLGAAIAFKRLTPAMLGRYPLGGLSTLLSVSLATQVDRSQDTLTSELLLLFTQVSSAYFIAELVAGASGSFGQALRLSPLTRIGRISYSLYLLHNFAWIPQQRLERATSIEVLGAGWIAVGTSFCLTFSGACLSWILVEAPLLRLKNHFPYTKPPAKRRHARVVRRQPPMETCPTPSSDKQAVADDTISRLS
ncbi:MAG: acyltransferase family protein [Planctomycetaceae bacterium]